MKWVVGLTGGGVTVMTAAAESTRVPAAGGGAVRAVAVLVEPGPAGEPGRTAAVGHEGVAVTEHRRSVFGGAAGSRFPPTPGGHRGALGRVLRRVAADEGGAGHVRGGRIRGHRDRSAGPPGSVSAVAAPQAGRRDRATARHPPNAGPFSTDPGNPARGVDPPVADRGETVAVLGEIYPGGPSWQATGPDRDADLLGHESGRTPRVAARPKVPALYVRATVQT